MACPDLSAWREPRGRGFPADPHLPWPLLVGAVVVVAALSLAPRAAREARPLDAELPSWARALRGRRADRYMKLRVCSDDTAAASPSEKPSIFRR